MKETCKILMWKDGKYKVLGMYPMFVEVEGKTIIGSCGIPQLMSMKTTIEKLRDLNPTVDFKDVELITVTVQSV